MNLSAIWDYISKFDTAISIGTFGLAVYGWLKLRRYEKIYKEKIRRITEDHAPFSNAVLIMDIGEGSIRTEVERFIYENPALKDIIKKENIFHIDKGWINAGHVGEIIKEVRAVRKKILDLGITKIHFFDRGPNIGAAIVGSVFSNGCPVLYYKRVNVTDDTNDTNDTDDTNDTNDTDDTNNTSDTNSISTYKNWGPIERY